MLMPFVFLMQGCLSSHTYEIMTDSMSPTIQLGATVKVEDVTADDLVTGDLVMVRLQTSVDESGSSIDINAPMMIASIETQNDINGNAQTYFQLTTNNAGMSVTVTIDDILGRIIEINNP